MKFGKHLLENQVQGWAADYVDYKKLKKILNRFNRQNFAHYAPYTAAVEKEFFEAVRREVDKAEKFYVDILDILKTDFQDLILQSYRLLAIKKIFKKHDKIVGAVAVNQEMEALKYDVIDTITKKKAFWVKGEKSVGELLNEAENFQLEIGKMSIRNYCDMIP